MKTTRIFSRAIPVWPADLAGEMNVWLSFHARLDYASDAQGILRLAGAQAYRVWANGEVVGRGPARTAHGFARVDEWPVAGDGSGVLELVIEVMGYGVPTFCSTNEPAFICAELVSGGKVLTWTSAGSEGGMVAEQHHERLQKASDSVTSGLLWSAIGSVRRDSLGNCRAIVRNKFGSSRE